MKHKLPYKSLRLLVMTCLFFLLILTGKSTYAQLTGSIAIPSGNYPTIRVAVDSLNLYGVGTGGVIFNVAPASIETAPAGGIKLTATGTVANPIIIRKDPISVGANPVITSYVGTSTTLDGVFLLLGSDYVTIDGIDIMESAGNTTATTQMEWGYALLNKSNVAPFNGCNNNTITNASITLNRTNTASKGIYSSHHIATSTTALTITAVGDANSNNKFYSNKIQNVWVGIYLVGFDDPTFTFRDVNNDIGGSSYATADTITGLGIGVASAATGSQGVYMLNQMNPNISYNYIDNALGGVPATLTVSGIYAIGSFGGFQSLNNHITITHNSITMTQGANGVSYCANVQNYDGNITITHNDIKLLATATGTGAQYGVFTTHASNPIGTATYSLKYNTAQNFTINNSTGIVYLFSTGSINQAIQDISYNVINNITRINATNGNLFGFYTGVSSLGIVIPGSVTNVYNNTITNITISNNSVGVFQGIQSAGNLTCNYYNNEISNINCTSPTGQVAVTGILQNSGGDINIYNNIVSAINGSRDLHGIYTTQVTRSLSIYDNKVNDLVSAGSGNIVCGISLFSQGSNFSKVYNNKIYRLTESAGGLSSAQGININNGASGVTAVYVPLYIYNNIIGNIKAPLSTVTATPSVMGINIGSSNTNPFNAYIRYNNIYLNDTAGANTHSAAIFHNYVASRLFLNNNLLVNNTYHAPGTGIACGIMRSGVVLTSYDVTSGNNLISAGIPSSRNVIHFDGTNKDSVFNAFKIRVAPREMSSFTQNITMFNAGSTPPVTAASANYLQNDTTVASVVESGAANIAGITTDIRGVIRQGNPGYVGTGSKPDIGAFESQGTSISMTYDSVMVIKDNTNALVNYNNQQVVDIQVYVSGSTNVLSATSFTVSTNGSTNVANMSKAKLFYCGSGLTLSTATPFGSAVIAPNGTFTFTGSQALVNGANNFWLVYDIAPTATVGHIVDAEVINVVVSGVTKTPLNGNPTGTKTITAPLNGAYTVGTGSYITLAAIVNALNVNGISGNVTVNLPAGFTETAPAGGYVLGSTLLNSSLNVNGKLVFQKSGIGANPLLTAGTGTSTVLDGIFTMLGTDNVTIDGIDLVDLNTVSATTQMEWGYGLLKANGSAPYDGCQNVVIKNSVITLNIGNTVSKGIYGNNHLITDATLLTLSDISETNSNNSFLGNTIQNVNTGISLMGYSISTQLANTNLYDQNNIIGDSATGNTIINFGGITAGFGINVFNQSNAKISYNTVDNASGGIAASALPIGIQHNYIYTSGPNPNNVTLTNNDVTLTILQGATIGMQNIFVQNTHGHVIMNNNNIKWVTPGTGANGGPYLGITFNTLGASYLANSFSFKGNTAKNFSFISGGTGAHIVFNLAGAALTEDIAFDSIYSISRIPGSAASTATLTLFYNYTGSNPGVSTVPTLVRNIHDNYIVNVNNGSTSTGGITIMNIGSTYNLNAYNNRISSIVNSLTGNTVYGIFVSGIMQNCTIYNNRIDTLSGGTGSTYGINFSNATGISASVNNNSISNLSSAGTSASLASGIYFISGGRNVSVYNNRIYNIVTTASGAAYASGIYYNNIGTAAYNLTPSKFYNNVISGIAAPSATSNPSVVGITVGYLSTATYPFAQLYNNTISLTGTTGNNVHSAGIYTVNVSNGMLKLSNNIVLNDIAPAGTGIATALFRNGTSLTAFDPTSGNNIYWAGTPSATHLIYYDGLNKDQTISAYKSRVYPRENGSESENVTMISTVGTNPYYLYPDTTMASAVSNGGISISGITTDFINTTRSLTTPDIGAYEGNFTVGDITAPAITMAPLPNAAVSASTLSFTATIKDLSGTSSIASGNGPRVFYKKTGGTYVNDLGALASGTVNNGVWTFGINAATLGGWIVGDTVSYYVGAQDVLSNVGSGPFGAVGSNVGSITTDPTPYKFVITNGLTGNYSVCATGCDFNSLSNVYGAFDSINKSVITGNVTLAISGDLLTESGSVGLNQIAQAGNYKVSIVPNSATERLIVGSIGSASGIINLNGADNVTIDGRFAGSGKYLRIRNRNVNGCTIKLMNDAHLDTIRYVNIEGNTSAVGTVYFNTPSATGTGNDSNAVMFCDIRDTLGNGIDPSPSVFAVQNTCFYSDGNMNSANTISNNNFYNYIYQGINFASNLSAHDNWVINQNSFYQLPPVQAKANSTSIGSQTQAVYLGSGQGHTITNNSIGGSAPDRSGAPSKGLYINSGYAISYYGIVLLTNLGLDQTTIISGNKISNIDANPLQGYNQFAGITVQSGKVSITGNTIGGGALPYDTIKEGSYSNSNVGGIVLAGGIVDATGNTVGNISNYLPNNSPGTTGIRTVGINIVGAATAPYIFSVLNNTVRDIRSNYNYVASSGFQHYLNPQGTSPVGILVTAGTGVTANIEGNTVHNITNTSTQGLNNQANGITIKGGVCTVQRNRVYNINAIGTGLGANASGLYGIYINATSPLGQVVKNNQVSLIPNTTNESNVFGIVDGSTATLTNTITNNSVYIGGTASGNNSSYALLVGSPASFTTMNVMNNILHNGRTGGSASHVAASAYFTSTAINASTFGYNLLVSPSANTLMEIPTGTFMNAASINSMYSNASRNSNWMETSANVAAASLFTNTATGDLGLNATNAASWYANGKGLPITSVVNDFANAARSTTIAGGSTDIGSVEVTPSVAPASAVASATPALNTTTTYTFGNRTVAQVTWGAAGTVPTALDVKYYTGTNAPSLVAGKTQYNAYYAVTPTGGTGYTYNMALSYDSAVMGNVGSTAASRLAYYKSPSWSWLSTSNANGGTGMLSAGTALAGTTLPANFTGTNVSNPLPVRLVKFVATAAAGDVQLGWTTATETNNKGFEVERSVDGSSFENIGFVKGAGNSSRIVSYGLTDKSAFATTNSNILYYRLKQVDMDGNISYSEAINVTTKMVETMNVSMYPNPASDVFNVSAMATTEGMMIVTIADLQGKVISSYSKEVAAGMNTLTIDGSTLNGEGIYFVKVMVDGESKVMKLLKR